MLRLIILRSAEGRYAGAEFDGHAGDAVQGKNLACAAVSALVQTLLLGLQRELGLGMMVRAEKRGGNFAFRIEGPVDARVQESVDLLFKVFIHGVEWIASQEEAKDSIESIESIIIQDAG